MTRDDRSQIPEDSQAGDPLDELLAQARWPEPTPLQLARLERRWDRLRPRSGRWQLAAITAAAAAVIVGALFWLTRPGPDRGQDRPLADRPHADRPRPENRVEPTPSDEPQLARAISPIGRPATTLEAVAFAVGQQRERQLQTDPLEQAVRTLTGLDPTADPALWVPALAAELGGATEAERQAWEGRLVGEIPRSQGERRRALVRLLGEFAGPRSVPLLVALSQEPQCRPLAEPILLGVADPLTLLRLASAETHPARQSRYLSELLLRSDSEAHALFFQAAVAPATRRGALLAMRASANPPTKELFIALNDSRPEVRTVAALLIGEIHDPAVTGRLLELARRDPSREAYWVALLQRRDPAAAAIVREAGRHPQLMATLGTAEFARRLMTEDTLPPIPF